MNKLKKALGLGDRQIRSITLKVSVGAVVTVEVEEFVKPECGSAIIDAVSEFAGENPELLVEGIDYQLVNGG